MPNRSNHKRSKTQDKTKLQALGLRYFVQSIGVEFSNVSKRMLESWGKQLKHPKAFLANPELLRAHNAYRQHRNLGLRKPKHIQD